MSAPANASRFERAIAEIDRLNAADPRRETADGVSRPREVLYSERLSAGLAQLYPEASESLRLAARAQHICRWQIARDSYPLGRQGYNAWRTACRQLHADLVTGILTDCGYPAEQISHVVKLIKKQDLKSDAESQALENAVGVVFVEHYLGAFVDAHPDYDDEKLLGILSKTMRKMDHTGHAAIAALDVTASISRLLTRSANNDR